MHEPAAANRPSALRNVVAAVAALVVSTLVALLVCEGLVRLVRPQLLYRYPQGLYVNDPDLVYRLTPGFQGRFVTPEYAVDVTVNGQGLRADRDYGPKSAGTFRILVIGDSFTMGHSVEASESFVAVLQNALAEHAPSGRRYEVVNAGVPGYNTAQEVAYLRREGGALQPDLVILAFFVGNDIRDNAVAADHVVVRDGYLVERNPPVGLLPESFRMMLARHSHLYHLAWPLQRLLRRNGAAEFQAERREELAVYATADDALREPWRATLEQLRLFDEARRTAGIPAAALVIIPDLAQVAWANTMSILPEAERRLYDPASPDRRLMNAARALNLRALDLLPTFQEQPNGERMFFPQDRHFTVDGNRIAGETIADFLVRDQLVTAGN